MYDLNKLRDDMSYDEFLRTVYQEHLSNKHDDYRVGQVFFNMLCEIRPAIAEELRGSMLDPFFKHRITQVVSDFVRERW